ncbi:hypothetical protein [Kitasatospora sp. NPDC094015]|uniref:hypothetical protein n=1 Tax=Kitasatospora sp. NPDC094015 TaxID=3155205 RepID=UPI003327FC1F
MSAERAGAPDGPVPPRRWFGRRATARPAVAVVPGAAPVAAVAPMAAVPSVAALPAMPASAADPARAAAPAGTMVAPAGTAVDTGRSVLRRLGPHFVIAPASVGDGELSAAAGALRPVPDSLIVIAAAPDAAPVLRDEMATLGRLARERGAGTLILAASGLAALAPNGRRPAEKVADKAGVAVIAPDGLVAIQPDGTLKVTAPNGSSQPASWWVCRPGERPRRLRETVTATTPAEARPGLPAVAPARPLMPASVAVTKVAAGFWLTHVTAPPDTPLPAIDLLAAPPGTVVLLVGTPALPVVDPLDFAEAVAALPVGRAQLLVSAPWADPETLTVLTGTLAARLGRPVHAAIGLPVAGPAGWTSRVLDRTGAATWEPYLLRLTSTNRHNITTSAWRDGGARWAAAGPGMFQAFPFWALETVPAGLWLRPEPPFAWAPRFLRPDPARPLLIVGEQSRPIAQEVWEELGGLLDRFPPPGPRGFGLLLHGLVDPASESVARFVARMHELEWLGSVGSPVPAPGSYAAPYPLAHPAPQPIGHPVPQPAGLPAGPYPGPQAGLHAGPQVGPAPVAVPGIDPEPGRYALDPGAGLPGHPAARPDPLLDPLPDPLSDPLLGPLPPPPAPTGPDPVEAGPADRFPTVDTVPPPAPHPSAATAQEPPPAPEPYAAPDLYAVPDPYAVPEPYAVPDPYAVPEPFAVPDPYAVPEPFAVPDPAAVPAGVGAPGPVAGGRAFEPQDFVPVPTVSGPADRDALRALLGDQYQRCASRVEQAATRLPGLRSNGKDDIKPDLVAVLLHHTGTDAPAARPELVAAARSGAPGRLAPYLTCLGSGLRRLPSHHGAVLLGADLDEEALAAYQVGRQLLEPAPLAGLTSPAVALGTAVEFAVWSTTGRRTAAFGATGEEAQVVFAPGTRFVVVEVLPAEGLDRIARVLLRETAAAAGADSADRDRSARERLHTWLARRDKVPTAERRAVERPERFRLSPGFDLPQRADADGA